MLLMYSDTPATRLLTYMRSSPMTTVKLSSILLYDQQRLGDPQDGQRGLREVRPEQGRVHRPGRGRGLPQRCHADAGGAECDPRGGAAVYAGSGPGLRPEVIEDGAVQDPEADLPHHLKLTFHTT